MKRNKKIQDRIKKIPDEILDFVDTSFEIVDRIHTLLEEKGMEQKDLAVLLEKSESEISKWMSGTHNFTIKTLSKIQSVLEAPIIQVAPLYIEERPQKELNLIRNHDKYENIFNLDDYKTYTISKKKAVLV